MSAPKMSYQQQLSTSSSSYGAIDEAPHHLSKEEKAISSWRKWDRLALLLGGLACGLLIGIVQSSVSYRRWEARSAPDLVDNTHTITEENVPMDLSEEEETAQKWEEIKEESLLTGLANGAVATDDGRCSDLGNSILEEMGGNAIDAAVTVTLCLGIVNPAGSTPGGGAFALLHADANPERTSAEFIDARKHPYDDTRAGKKVTEVIDCRETAPGAATSTLFDDEPEDASWTGGLASAVPGQFHCLNLMHSRHGRLPWKDIIMQVVPMAREGMEVTPYLAHAINLKSSEAKIFKNEALTKLLTRNQDGETLLQAGDILANPALADTLEEIAKYGIGALYTGQRAATLEQEFKDVGGIITAEDFENYRATLRDPLITQPGELKGFTMVGVPPASSGGCVVIGAARFLAGYPEDFGLFEDTLSEHRTIEAMKHAYSLRMSLSDPAFFSNVTEAAVNDMMHGNYMENLRRITKDDGILDMVKYGGSKWGILENEDVEIGQVEMTEEGHDNRRRLLRSEGHEDQHGRNLKGFQYLNDHGTTHFAIIDKEGNTVTMTTTINTYFGSGIVSPSTGIIFNSQMDDFSSPGKPNHYGVEPSESNYIVAGKKPLSSMSPTLVFRPPQGVQSIPNYDYRDLNQQELVASFGASGGPKIPTAVLQCFINLFFLGMPVYEAVVRPRLHNQLLYKGFGTTLYDHQKLLQGPLIETPSSTKHALLKRGQTLAPVTNTGSVQAITVDMETGLMSAVSDPRKGGRPAGH